MKLIAGIIAFLFCAPAISKTLTCGEHPAWPNSRSFSATIELTVSHQRYFATLTNLTLSETWPLPKECDTPTKAEQVELQGYAEFGEIKLGIKNGAECGFTLFLKTEGEDPSMLSPRKSYKVFGESPFLAECHAI